ncbi:MAG: aminotransferase class I/II-fold pyridoxal phosphate-dependent enzyme [Alphaproteobacteria bacterium]|nr:aminotransferase class I/II-fold pyridoxal phosphate-dependent enzyme [Alphaproteobacteria bacterium]
MIKLVETSTEFELSPTLAANEMVARCRAEGRQVLHMGFGQSPFPVPERLQEALRAGVHRKEYLPTGGLEALRDTVAAYYKNKIGLDTDRYDVIVAPGSKLILYALQMAIEGDLLMPVPSWVSYKPQARMLRTDVIKVPTTLDDAGFHIDPEELRRVIKAARAQGQNPSKIILNYPSNPTGLTIAEKELEAIAKVCVEEDIFIISDEIYGFVSFDGVYRTISKYAPNHTAVTSGLSKHLSLGGWRIGIGFIPKAVDGLYSLMCNIASETWSCVPSPIQQAVIEAYKGHEDIEAHIQACTDIHGLMNRYIAAGLRDLGVYAPEPQGAFYNYPDFEAHRAELAGAGIHTSKDLADALMRDYGLASLPGTAFGAEPEVLTLRLSGCDYDGAEVLAAFHAGEELDEAFIRKNAPRVCGAVEAFGAFLEDLRVRYKVPA